jgi:4-amino-4-deoxy-L-arabinose transferase-like glycosyltransferase
MSFLKKNWALLAIILIALIVRLVFVNVAPVKLWDETVYVNLGYDLSHNPLDYSFANHGWSDFIPGGLWPKAGFRAPLLPYLIALFYFLKLDFLIYLLMPIIGTLTVILVYSLGSKLFSRKVGLYSALFLALTPFHVFYSSRVLTDAFVTFFLLLSMLVFWKGYEENNNKWKVLFGFFLALSLYARYTTFWIFPLFPIYLFLKNRNFGFLKDKYLWYAVGVFFLTLAPWFFYGWLEYGNPLGPFLHGHIASSYWGSYVPWNSYLYSMLGMFSLPLALVFIFSLIYIFYKKDFWRKEIFILLIWIALIVCFVMMFSHKEDRYILPIAPAVCLVCGFFVEKTKMSKLSKRLLIFALLFGLLISLNMLFYSTFKVYNTTNTECFLEIVNYTKGINGTFMMVSENPPLFYYYVKQESVFYPDHFTLEKLKSLESANKSVYFIFTRFNSGFETETWTYLKKLLSENYEKVFECKKDPEVNFIYSN